MLVLILLPAVALGNSDLSGRQNVLRRTNRPPDLLCKSMPLGPLGESADKFKRCLKSGGDIDLLEFIEAASHFIGVLKLFGKYTRVQIGASSQNLAAIKLGVRDIPRGAQGSAREFLEYDKARGKHRPGGILAKDSPAEGLLWLRRGFSIWLATFEEHLASPGSLRQEARRGYEATVLKYNGWLMQRACAANMALCPTWEWVLGQAKLASSEEQLRSDLEKWVAAARPVLERLTALHKSLDLEDTRKAN